jgi:hypothetical protein
MAMSKEGIESKVIKGAFICLAENQRAFSQQKCRIDAFWI